MKFQILLAILSISAVAAQDNNNGAIVPRTEVRREASVRMDAMQNAMRSLDNTTNTKPIQPVNGASQTGVGFTVLAGSALAFLAM
jgi:hypothetical protein